MSNPELNSLDDYQQHLTNVITSWSREQRIALAAAMAERWLPVYESFSEEGGFEVRSPYEPHSYGPSLRQLCIERRLASDSDQDVWDNIEQWTHHRPAAWEEEDRRKKNKLAYATPELGERLTLELNWRDTGDVNYPWTTDARGETWRIGLNDFPDDLMYTLIVDDKVIGKFHDWPECWRRNEL